MSAQMWKMRDGTTVRIVDMADSHILNALWMLDRGFTAQYFRCAASMSSLGGDMAICAADAELDRLLDDGPSAFYPAYGTLYTEAESRGLNLAGLPR